VITPCNRYVDLLEVGSEGRRRDSPAPIKSSRSAAGCRNAAITAARANIVVDKMIARLQRFDLVLRQVNGGRRVAADCLTPDNIEAAQGIAQYRDGYDIHRDEKFVESKTSLSSNEKLF
jgi:hypothetical protein